MFHTLRALRLTPKFTLLLGAFLLMQGLQIGLVVVGLTYVNQEVGELYQATEQRSRLRRIGVALAERDRGQDLAPVDRPGLAADARESDAYFGNPARFGAGKETHSAMAAEYAAAARGWREQLRPAVLRRLDAPGSSPGRSAPGDRATVETEIPRFDRIVAILHADIAEDSRELMLQLAAMLLLSMLIGIGGYAMARRIVVRPMLRLTEAAGAMAGGSYGRRVTVESVDELGELAGTFNRMAEAVQRKTENLAALNEIAVALSSALELREMLEEVLRRAVILTGARAACIALMDPATGRYTDGVMLGFAEDMSLTMALPGNAAAAALAAGNTVQCLDLPGAPYALSEALRRAGFRAQCCLPLSAHGTRLGVVCVYHTDRSQFSADESALLATFAGMTAGAIHNARLYVQTHRDSLSDELTGLPNRRALDRRLGTEISRAQRYGKPLAVVMLDIDLFKRVNDLYHHQAGDTVLAGLAAVFRAQIRDVDFVARYGGEEFVFVLPETDAAAARVTAERTRRAVAERPVPLPDGRAIAVTVSLGIADYPACAATIPELINRADQALYTAKQSGRNCTVLYRDMLKTKLEREPRRITELLNENLENSAAIVTAIDLKTQFMRAHSVCTGELAARLGRALGFGAGQLEALRLASLLHDVGTITVPETVLNKNGGLEEAEWRLVRQHASDGAELLAPVAALRSVVPVVRHHHERFDGGGYPDGLRGESIPPLARVLAVADAWCAIRAERPHRRPLSVEEARAVIAAGAGRQFDPAVVRVFLDLPGLA